MLSSCVTDSTMNLISIPQLDDAGCKVEFEKGKCIISKGTLSIIGRKDSKTNLYEIVDGKEESSHPQDFKSALMIRKQNGNKQTGTLHDWPKSLNHIG